jgi:hypothetical protein
VSLRKVVLMDKENMFLKVAKNMKESLRMETLMDGELYQTTMA